MMTTKLLLKVALLFLYSSTVVKADGTCFCLRRPSSEDTGEVDCNTVVHDHCEEGFHCNCNFHSVFVSDQQLFCASDAVCEGDEHEEVLAPTPAPCAWICPPGTDMCMDPHMSGLRGQRIDVSGVDGGWYCLVKDEEIDFHANVRFTAPLPDEFPNRQLISGFAVLSGGHSLVIEVRNPYNVETYRCPEGISPCLADGGVRFVVDGQEISYLLRPTRNEPVVEGMEISSSNLPVECRQFGGDKIWAKMFEERLRGSRTLHAESFEDWVLRFDHMAAPGWCAKYVSERGLANVQSNHAIFRIMTPQVAIRLIVGVNHQGDGQLDWDGRVLPELDFWQMEVGFKGLSLDHPKLTGLLGETARPVLDDQGHTFMEGHDALRGIVDDYGVTGAIGTDFGLLHV